MRLPFLPTDGCCRLCGRDAVALNGEYTCEDCRTRHRPRFDRAASSLRFESDVRRLILDYKFNHHLWMRDDFVDWLEATVRTRFSVADIDVILPMPVTLWHRLDRGFNQCDILARALARRLDRPCASHVVRRTGHPQRQSGLDEASRRENVKGTFAVRRPVSVAGRTVLVVDDIMTTGSTLSACAEALKDAGTKKVWCVTLARSVRY